MTIVSYGQNREDVVLARAFPPGYVGFYIDVGASDPIVDSVTKHFYDLEWHGVNIEPAISAFEGLRVARPRDVNLNLGLARAAGERTFYELPRAMTGCSTFSDDLAEEYRSDGWETTARTVEMTTLAAVCQDHAGEHTIDFLKIDVEGEEAEVLGGGDFERFRPRILVIEATVPGTSISSHDEWEPAVLKASYELALFDGLNRFYVREEDHELVGQLGVPANVLDDYISYPCLMWRERAEVADFASHAEREAQTTLTATREELAQANTALVHTRKELAQSQASLRDARVELTAARQALIAALPDRPLPGTAA